MQISESPSYHGSFFHSYENYKGYVIEVLTISESCVDIGYSL